MKKKKQNNWLIPVIAIGILIIFAIIFLVFSNSGGSNVDYETKTSSGEVTIDLTPVEFKDGNFYVNIGINTHTVSLEDYDLKQLVILQYSGVSVRPEQAPELKSHHNSGVLVFKLEDKPSNFRIIIRGIPDIEEGIFEW